MGAAAVHTLALGQEGHIPRKRPLGRRLEAAAPAEEGGLFTSPRAAMAATGRGALFPPLAHAIRFNLAFLGVGHRLFAHRPWLPSRFIWAACSRALAGWLHR